MEYYSSFILLFIVGFANFDFGFCQSPIVRIADGQLKGKFLQSRDDKTYSAFLGIPYAKQPERFQLAEFPEPWEGTRDATQFGSMCKQGNPYPGADTKFMGSDDCLFVNVYAPGRMTKKNLPVLVFIHGGGFFGGAADDHGANYFMDHDVVLVTLNYRLGPFGFLSTDDGVIESNLGLKDQRLALKWVQKHIRAFGGDPKKVTIAGVSAGGVSVHYQVLSPLNEGLFQQAIIQSGSAINPWAYTNNAANIAVQLGDKLGCKTQNSQQLLKCLQGKTSEEILSGDLHEWYLDPLTIFPPTKDSPHSKQILIPDHPLKLMESGKFNRIPLLVTACEDEGLTLHSAIVSITDPMRNEMNKDWKRVLPITLQYNRDGLSQTQQDWISSEVKRFYFGGKEVGVDTFANLTNMYSDRMFLHGVEKIAKFHAKHTTVYNALLAYKGAGSLISTFMGIKEPLGVAHGDDMQYLFNGVFFSPDFIKNSADEKASRVLVSMFAQFVSTGKPEFKWPNVKWMPFSTRGGATWFKLNFPPEILENPFKERMEFWDRVLAKPKHDEL